MPNMATSRSDLARKGSLVALAGLDAIAVLAVSAIVRFHPYWWAIGFLGVAVAAAGLWGIAERALMDLELRGFPSSAREVGQYTVLGEFSRIVAIVTAIVFAVFGPGVWLFGQIGVGSG